MLFPSKYITNPYFITYTLALHLDAYILKSKKTSKNTMQKQKL